ncbi:MAG TPA: FtsX-like permease family protein [Desulfobulbus sp.]|nr:FtsX-like permease family protein [Desulfobulbus sp.]
MNFLRAIVGQTLRNLRQTWSSQLVTLLTISLSVLIFSFFFLVYINVLNAGRQLGDNLRLIVYLDEEPSKPLQEEYRQKILKFDRVEKIEFVSSQQAYERFRKQLGHDQDVLEGMPRDFLPPSIEVYPIRSLSSLTRIKRFSDYLQTLPGVLKVQYGREWIDRFYSFVKLMRVVVILSGMLLILTTTFMVAHTIRLTLCSRERELELLRLLGASNHYIRAPFFLEGALQGLAGSVCGLVALYVFFDWIRLRFAGSAMLNLFPFTFFPVPVILAIVAASTLLCASGSFSSTRRILRL